jgi:hypothetical protein
MNLVDEFYREIDQLKRSGLLLGVLYKLNKQHEHFPFVYYEVVVLSFLCTIEEEKIIRVKEYIEQKYGINGMPAEKVELTTPHRIEVYLVKTRNGPNDSY